MRCRELHALWLIVTLGSFAASGCAIQSGLAGGAHVQPTGRDQAMWSGHVAALKTPEPNQDGLLVGAELEGKVGLDEGTRFFTGMQLGYGWAPSSHAESIGCEFHLDVGTELSNAGLFEHANGYVGGTLAAVVWLGSTRTVSDLNGEQWVLKPMPELLVFTRARGSRTQDCSDTDPMCFRMTFEIGLALRMALLSELL